MRYRSLSMSSLKVSEIGFGSNSFGGTTALFFDMFPSGFVVGVYRCFQAGARLLGGCCGTTPDHIRAMVMLLREK